VVVAALFIPAAAFAGESVLWLEAEQFAKTGGWVNDPQFVDLMGSPYLLANGVGHPVDDAATQADVPTAGRYRLWVRCKDWLPDYSPGTFQVRVGGKASDVTFGRAKAADWQWVDGGQFELKGGKVEVRLRDLTGWWGRCDAIVLALGFKPSNEKKTLAEQRLRYGGVSREVERKGPYNVVVVGGGLAGCAAAIAAARHGCQVALIQDRPVLGGNTSSEIMVPVGGDQSREPLDPRETGIAEELDRGPGRGRGRSDVIEKVVRAEKNLDLHLNTRATNVVMKDKKTIAGVLGMNVHTGRRMLFEAPLFIDGTGDGWIGFWAGATFRHGREARAEFNEPLAPEKADSHTMGNSLHNARFRTHDKPVPFQCPPWAYQWNQPSDFETRSQGSVHISGAAPPLNFKDLTKGRGRRPTDPNGALSHVWWVELGGMHNTIHDAEWIRDELFRIAIGLWNYAKNYTPRFKKRNANRELVWLNHVPGKRESRRLIGDYIMSQRDFAERIIHPDTVAYGGWTIDIHHPQGFWVRGPGAYHAYRYKVSIPYRILYSKDIDNLLMAGRCVSCTHVALGGIRVMRTTCLMGQAAGTAAAIARRHKATPRGVCQKHLKELQQTLLKDGCYLMGVKSEDRRDLALAAKATASSFARIAHPRLMKGGFPHGGTIHHIDVPRAVVFTAQAERIDSVGLYLRSDLAKPHPVTIVLRATKQHGDFSSKTDLAAATAAVPPNSSGWVTFPLKAGTEKGKLYWIRVPASPGLKWDLYPQKVEGHSRAYFKPEPVPMPACYKFRLNPGGEPARLAAAPEGKKLRLTPDHVNNGWNRAVRGYPNAWWPDPSQPLPQWVQLDFARPVAFNTVHVSFQNLAMAPDAFQIDVAADGQWQTVVKVTGRRQRRHVLALGRVTASKLRLVISQARRRVGVCEIRVYDEPRAPGAQSLKKARP